MRWFWLVLPCFVACKDDVVVDRNLTGIELTISYDPASTIDQIELSGALPDGTEAFAAGRLPDSPRPLTEGENSLVILLPDRMAGEMITIRASGLMNEVAVSTAEIVVVPMLRQLVPASGTLSAVVKPCEDPDGDGYGIGSACRGADCSEASPRCNADCSTDTDGDGTIDCMEDCADSDGDGYGDGEGCIGADCDDGSPSCNVDCTADVDADSMIDCAESCIDADGDGYGAGGGAGNTCLGTDCSDATAACTSDCSDADGDGAPDCDEGCVDFDRDGYGVGGTCTAADCDDAIATCTIDCTSNGDGDPLIDCNDPCVDADGDGYGVNGAGTCLGSDCDETHVACNADCAACLPAVLTVSSSAALTRCTDAALVVDLDGYDGAAGDLTCTAARIPVLPVEDFEGGLGRWSTRSGGDVSVRNFPDGFPASCDTAKYVRINDKGPDWFQLSTPIDATNLENLSLSARVGFTTATNAGEDLTIEGCCGVGCTPVPFRTVLNGSSGGTDECTDFEIPLEPYASNCASLMIRFSFPDSAGRTGIDNMSVAGDVTSLGVLSERSPGIYDAPFRVCEATTVPVTCTWNDGMNPMLSGSADIVFP